MVGIYKFTNNINGMVYIGQSTNIRKRYIQHKNRYLKDNDFENTYFHAALKEFGFDSFTFEILEECQIDKLNWLEQHYIKLYNSLYPNGYNKSTGGNYGSLIKLKTYTDIDKIIELLETSKLSNKEIGELFNISDQMVSEINAGRSWHRDNVIYPIRNGRRVFNTEHSITKGMDILKTRKCVWPTKEELSELIKNNSYNKIGKMYGVSGSAVLKWCKKYCITK